MSGPLNGLKSSTYALDMDYDTLHNIVKKSQDCRVNGKVEPPQSYVLNYQYGGPHPHAATAVGKRTFTYDEDGNQTGYVGKDDFGGNGTVVRNQAWDEEDRLASAGSPGNGNAASFVYDQAGQRIIKRSSGQELAYINPYFTVRNSDHKFLMTKHVFAGPSRIAASAFTGTLTAPHQDAFLFFYHGDHLASANYLSDGAGQLRQHIEYFPFGEPWVTQSRDNSDIVNENPYLFTGKEYDKETGLYYFGARYYDPRTSVWQNGDPLLSSFNRWTVNPFGHYAYASHNPLTRVDPNGLQDGTKPNGETVHTRTGKEAHVEFAEQKGASKRVGLAEHGPITDSLTETKNRVTVRELKPATRLENPYKMAQAVDQVTIQGEAAAEEFAGKAVQAELWSWARRANGSFLFKLVRKVPIAKALPVAVGLYVASKSGNAEAAVIEGGFATAEAADPTIIGVSTLKFVGEAQIEILKPSMDRLMRDLGSSPEDLVDRQLQEEQDEEILEEMGVPRREQWKYDVTKWSWKNLLNFDK